MSYVYLRSEPGLWTVGFYRPDGTWEPESDQTSQDDAANRVAWLNGGPELSIPALADAIADRFDAALGSEWADREATVERAFADIRDYLRRRP